MDVAELTEAFKEHGTGNQAELMHRVQELMGQGVDVSSLFPSMVSVSQKKATFPPSLAEILDAFASQQWNRE